MAIKIRKKVDEDVNEVVVSEEQQSEVVLDEAMDDQFVRTSISAHSWVSKNARLLIVLLALVLLGVIGFSVYRAVTERQHMEESSFLYDAMYSYETPTVEEAKAFEDQQKAVASSHRGEIFKYSNPAPSEEIRNSTIYSHILKFSSMYSKSNLRGLAQLMVASFALKTGKNDEAMKIFSAELIGGDFDIFALQGLAASQSDAAQYDAAVETWKKVEQLSGVFYGSYALSHIAEIYESTGRREDAILSYVEIVKKYPLSFEAIKSKERIKFLSADWKNLLASAEIVNVAEGEAKP